MDQVDFYVLESRDVNGKLKYACHLARKAYSRGLKVVIQTADKDQSEHLDALLWTFSQGSFIPHSIAAGGALDWDEYPVQLTDIPGVLRSADMIINLRRQPPAAEEDCLRVAELVSGEPADRESGREKFRHYKQNGVIPNTHQITRFG